VERPRITSRVLRRRAALLLAGVCFGAGAAQAQDASWIGTGPAPADWNTATNWAPATVPTGTATFTSSGTTTTQISTSAPSSIGTLQFDPGAPAYTFRFDQPLTITGAGFTGNAGAASMEAGLSMLTFLNASSAGNFNIRSGTVEFHNTSTAGNANVALSPNFSVFPNLFVSFFDASTAGNATFNCVFAPPNRCVGPAVTFFNTSSAGNATFDRAALRFHDNSTAGNATISSTFQNQQLLFFDTSSAGSANITNSNAGMMIFENSSTAGNATITNAAILEFWNSSTAGNATILQNGITRFRDTSTGGNATIINNGGLVFLGHSTAGNATITTNSGAVTSFFFNGTGGQARFITNGGGALDFSPTSGPAGDGQVSAGSIEGAGAVFLGASTLTVGSNNLSTTVSGVITDGTGSARGGSLVKVGTGTLTLSGANNYTGSTTVNGGVLQAGAANSFAPGSAFTVASGGTLDLNSFNQTIGSLAGAGPVMLGSAGLTTGNDNTSTTFSGAISGTGGLTKIGTGALQLAGTSNYTGATTVNAGTLVVTGSIANSAVTVNAGGTLAGTGLVGATTIMGGGTFAPGSGAPGTMTIQGNLAFQSGAIYLVQVTPSTASSANVTAGGSAALAGTVNASFAPGSYITRNYTILSASGGLGGSTFNGLATTNLPAGFTATLGYTADDVILKLTANLGGPGTAGLSINQANVANSLNTFFNSGGALPPGFVTIFGLTGANLGNALTQLSGEAATGAQLAAFQMGNQFLGLMLDPFVDGRSGVVGSGGPALGFAPEQEVLPEDLALAYSKVLKAPAAAAVPSFEQRWNVWGGAYGGGNKTSGDPAGLGSHDLTATTAGFAGGLDYRLTRDTVVGVALAGGGTGWNLSQGLGSGKSDAFQAGLYGATRWGAAYVAGAFAYTQHWMSTDRFAFAADHLTAKFNAQSYGGRIEGGYRFATYYGGITPYAAVQAQSFHTPGYAEVDGSGLGFGLVYNARTGTDTRSELGARFDRLLALSSYSALAFRGRLAWAHDWVSDPSLAALFQTLPGASFVVNGALPARDSALVSAGTELRLANGVTLLGKFDGEFASRSSTYAGTGTIRYAW
jgi:autotransporter-associated beta strand protein